MTKCYVCDKEIKETDNCLELTVGKLNEIGLFTPETDIAYAHESCYKMNREEKATPVIKHDHICKECGKPAEISTENIWTSYKIDSEGNFTANNDIDDETIEVYFWCKECFEHSGTWD